MDARWTATRCTLGAVQTLRFECFALKGEPVRTRDGLPKLTRRLSIGPRRLHQPLKPRNYSTRPARQTTGEEACRAVGVGGRSQHLRGAGRVGHAQAAVGAPPRPEKVVSVQQALHGVRHEAEREVALVGATQLLSHGRGGGHGRARRQQRGRWHQKRLL